MNEVVRTYIRFIVTDLVQDTYCFLYVRTVVALFLFVKNINTAR